MIRPSPAAVAALALVLAIPGGMAGGRAVTQPPASPAAQAATRASARLAALRREAEMLAGRERSLLGDLRKLEIERDLRADEVRTIEADEATVSRQIDDTTRQVASLQGAIDAARPLLHSRLVDVYKLGRPGYARILLGVGGLQDAGRATRLVSALATIDQRRVAEYSSSIGRLAAARSSLDREAGRLRGLRADAVAAADLAAQAAAARADLVRRIDERRDLNAQMAGDLEMARDRLQKTLRDLPSGAPPSGDAVTLPIRPFRGELGWPVAGRVLSRFGQHRNARFGTTTQQNGVEIASADGSEVRAVHDGRVAFADVFTGFGQLVIVDHGGLAFSLYGYLGSMAVAKGSPVAAGQVIGTTGTAPAGSPALYFELRIDGRPVDPLQWLKAR